MIKKPLLLSFIGLIFQISLIDQTDRWQQGCEYQMDIDFDVDTHRFSGKQTLKYINHSPEQLDKVFYHLYFNAFQPVSMMHIRNQNLPDVDPRIGGRIGVLEETEQGYQKINALKMDGEPVDFEVVGTILEVNLNKPIKPNSSVVFEMEFEAQVPLQIRRSGRENKEGIDYSMAQWYPKMCEYDYQGWHSNPYIGREFYGIWGDFDVKISIDKDYIIGGTGYLQNPEEIGYGYEENASKKIENGKLTWHFKAPKVHDFAWGADRDYEHIAYTRDNGMVMHFFYQPNEKTTENWNNLPKVMDVAFDYINKRYGEYPYQQYSFIQGGDGGMEYPMATLITGERTFGSLVGVSVHELMHSWYQMILGTNEALHAWMDEGFTSYASAEVMNYLKQEGLIPGTVAVERPQENSIKGYSRWAKSGYDEALDTHADHFARNQAYGVAAYTKGQTVLNQLNYIVGKTVFDKAMLRYFEEWKFKHPNPNDFIRIMEKESGMELDWFKEYYLQSTHTPDYTIESVDEQGKKQTKIVLKRTGRMPMPIDVVVTHQDNSEKMYHIPMVIMRGEKTQEFSSMKYEIMEDWAWVNPNYELVINNKLKKIKKVEIDPSGRLLDLNYEDNVWKK